MQDRMLKMRTQETVFLELTVFVKFGGPLPELENVVVFE